MGEITLIKDYKGDIIAMSGRSEFRKPEYVSDNPASAFARSAVSFPMDWWVAIHWANGLNGLYGPNFQRQARQIGRTLDAMLSMVVAGAPVTFKISWVVLKYIFTSDLTGYIPLDDILKKIDRKQFLYGSANVAAGAAGRTAGGMFTNYASTGGRAGMRRFPKGTKLRKGTKIGTTALASMGSLIKLAAKTRGTHVTAVDMMIALMTGHAGTGFDNDLWKELYTAVMEADLEYSKAEEDAFYKIMREAQAYYKMKQREAASGR